MGLCHIIRQDLLGTEILCEYLLYQLCKNNLKDRVSLYNIEEPESVTDLLTNVAISRKCLKPGGEPDLKKASLIVLKDYSDGKLGSFSMDLPDGETDLPQGVEVIW